MLTPDNPNDPSDNDYTLPLRHTCWIKINDRVLYIIHRPDEITIEVYKNNDVDDSPLYEHHIPFTTDNANL